jgi:hypothetical protein
MVMSAVAKNLSVCDNLSLTTGIFPGFIKHEIILLSRFSQRPNHVHLSYKKIAFPEPLDWL